MKIIYIAIILFNLLSITVYSSNQYITIADINFRTGPSTSYRVIGTIEKGDTVLYKSIHGDKWAFVSFSGKDGYVASKYLEEIAETSQTTSTHKSENNDLWVILFFLFFAGLILSIPILLYSAGKSWREKKYALLLSFFLGGVGFHKFYLGKGLWGIVYLVMCWTLVPLALSLIDFLILLFMSDRTFDSKYNTSTNHSTPTFRSRPKPSRVKTSPRKQNKPKPQVTSTKKESIIDINKISIDVSIPKTESVQEEKQEAIDAASVPDWSHRYIFSKDELSYANNAQRKFYNNFKKSFLKGIPLDINGNTNYAFVLYFELLDDYDSHQDKQKLIDQFDLLNQICPKTTSYTRQSLRQIIDGYSQLSYDQNYSYDYYDNEYRLGNQYKEKLGLNDDEVSVLNKFWLSSNVFNSIEGACSAIIKYYLFCIKEFNKEGSLTDMIESLQEHYEKSFKKDSTGYWSSSDSSYLKHKVEDETYSSIFRKAEKNVREIYGNKRTISAYFNISDYGMEELFQSKIGDRIDTIISSNTSEIIKPDLETEKELNRQNVNRWKIQFDELKENIKSNDIESFVKGINHLEEANQSNPNIESIFFEASKLIAKNDQVLSLSYYAMYVFYDLKSKKFDNKQLTKTVQKSLFKTEEQIQDFRNIIETLINDSDIDKALASIADIYKTKRKKILLDHSEIQSVEEKHSDTVERLNQYLSDEEQKNHQEPNEEEVVIIPEEQAESESAFHPSISMTEVQENLVLKIIENSYTIEQSYVAEYALSNGLGHHQLIESINDACSESLDGDALIEEDEDNYIIEESFVSDILTNK